MQIPVGIELNKTGDVQARKNTATSKTIRTVQAN